MTTAVLTPAPSSSGHAPCTYRLFGYWDTKLPASLGHTGRRNRTTAKVVLASHDVMLIVDVSGT